MAKKDTNNIYSFSFTITKKKFWICFSVIIIILLVFLWSFKSYFVVAAVNGHPIWSWTYQKDLISNFGKQSLDMTISQEIVNQDAQRMHVSVTPQEVDERIQNLIDILNTHHTTLSQWLSAGNISMAHFREQTTQDILLEKLLKAHNIAVSDKEVKDFLAKNPAPSNYPPDVAYSGALDTITRQKEQTFISQLQKRAKISYFINF